MNASKKTFAALVALVSMNLVSSSALAGEMGLMLDDFSSSDADSMGVARVVVNDASVGGASQASQTFADGVLTVEGKIAPARGQPGWVSMALLLNGDGSAKDLSQYKGIRMRERIRKGMLSVSANSSKVGNFDYHAAMVVTPAGAFHVVEIPFASMKRAWSEQTALDTATIASVSLVAVNTQPAEFAYDIDEIGFY